MTTCPSGVNYMHLVDQARVKIENDYTRPLPERVLRSVLAWVLPRPEWFRAGMILARLGRPDVIGTWVGGGELAARVTRQARALPPGQFRLAGERSDILDILPAFDVFALPSRYEGLPTAVVEAMICGVPVVATAVNAVPDLVVPGETGLLVPPRRPAPFAIPPAPPYPGKGTAGSQQLTLWHRGACRSDAARLSRRQRGGRGSLMLAGFPRAGHLSTRAHSSAEEHPAYNRTATGSIPVAPTFSNVGSGRGWFECSAELPSSDGK